MVIDLAAFWRVVGRLIEGRLSIKRGEFESGVLLMRSTLDTCERTGWTMGFPGVHGPACERVGGARRATSKGSKASINLNLSQTIGVPEIDDNEPYDTRGKGSPQRPVHAR
jgi:hypothetical protein